jgi:hypothetical protein
VLIHRRAASVCNAFPDDSVRTDSLIVALISLAVSLPVSAFLASCFEVANDSEAPESWLEWSGLARRLVERRANRLWNYTGERGQPARLVRWWIRSSGAPAVEMLVNLAHKLLASCCPAGLPWVRRRIAVETHEVADDASSARQLLTKKHGYTAVGLTGLYLVWAVFTWCVSPGRGRSARLRVVWRFTSVALTLPSLTHAGSSSPTASSYTAFWARARRHRSHAPGA